jgi:hypothetical protein
MNAGLATPSTASSHLEQERQRIGRLLDDIARLCESDIPAAGFFGEMLKRLLDALQAPAGAIWLRTSQGNIQLQYHINLKLVGLDKSEQAKQSHEALLMAAFSQPKPFHLPPNSGLGPPADGQVAPGNPSDFILMVVPIVQDGLVTGVIEVWQNANRPANAIPGFMQYISLMAELCARYLRHRKMSELAGQQQLWTQLEAFARQIHGSLNPIEVAYLVANEGRRLIECDRVSAAVRYGNNTSVEAVSGADVVEKRSNLIVLMRVLCDKVIRWGEKLVYKGEKDDTLPPQVLKALDDYLAESNSRLLVVQPLRDEREGTDEKKKRARSVLVMESFEAPTDPEQMMARMEVVGKHAASALYNAIEHKRIPMRFLWVPLAKVQEGLGGKAKAIMALITVALTMLICALVFLPYPLKMEGQGKLLPSIRRVIYSPTKGIVNEFYVMPAEDVVEGRSLAALSDLDLEKMTTNLKADIRRADLAVKGLRDQEKSAAPADQSKLRAQAREKEAERDSKARELEGLVARTNADPQHEGQFFLKAPQMKPEEARLIESARHGNHKREWTVLNGDFREQWTNKEAKPSDPLLRLGAKDGPWEIELKVPQKYIGQIQKAFETKARQDPNAVVVLDVDILLKSDPTRVFKGKLYRNKVSPEAIVDKDESNEPEPTVLAIVSIDDKDIDPAYRLPPELLLSGAEVHAKVRCGNHSMGYSLFYGAWEFFYEKIVFFF